MLSTQTRHGSACWLFHACTTPPSLELLVLYWLGINTTCMVRTLECTDDDTDDSDACELCTVQLTTIIIIISSSSSSSTHHAQVYRQQSSLDDRPNRTGCPHWVINAGRVGTRVSVSYTGTGYKTANAKSYAGSLKQTFYLLSLYRTVYVARWRNGCIVGFAWVQILLGAKAA